MPLVMKVYSTFSEQKMLTMIVDGMTVKLLKLQFLDLMYYIIGVLFTQEKMYRRGFLFRVMFHMNCIDATFQTQYNDVTAGGVQKVRLEDRESDMEWYYKFGLTKIKKLPDAINFKCRGCWSI